MTQRRIRRIAKWIGLAMCVIMVLALILTGFWAFRFQHGRFMFKMGRGATSITVLNEGSFFETKCELWDQGRSRGLTWWRFDRLRSQDVYAVQVPVWIPILAIAIPTFILWWRDRRHPPGHCQRCGYDLTGNVTGVCSECGSKVEASPPPVET